MSERVTPAKEINACCTHFRVLLCANSGNHQHIACNGKAKLGDNPLITNEHAKQYCLGDESNFTHCPHYPKYG
ncbi:hypothetical protein ES703_99755 [subsurface metagenome]